MRNVADLFVLRGGGGFHRRLRDHAPGNGHGPQ